MAGNSAVLAGTSNLHVVVSSALTPPPLPDVVSPSASTCTFPTLVKGCTTAAYSVAIDNPTSSNVSNAWFHATTYVFDSTGAVSPFKAQFLSVPSFCSVSADSTTIACQIGNVPSGQVNAPFVVTVHSPSVTAKGYLIQVAWDVPTGQGASGSLSPVSSSSAIVGDPAVTQIGDPPTPKKATTRSWVTTATDLYTGDTDIATSSNLGTVKAHLPKAPDTFVATLTTEVTNMTFCTTSDFPSCIQYTLTIPGIFDDGTINGYMTFIVQRDTSTIKNGAKASNVILYHQGPTDAFPGLPIQDCDPSTGLIPTAVPGYAPDQCIVSREQYPNNAGKDLKGDFKITIRARTNGIINW